MRILVRRDVGLPVKNEILLDKGHPFLDQTDEPCQTISTRPVDIAIDKEGGKMPAKQSTDKPIYKVPSMAEIEALPPNGFNVISTFSGAGGSCLGYRMAGFRVLWANEFIPAARDTYKLNHPDSILDARDIRTVTGAEILEATSLKKGELDLFDGSPPCASFSTAGKREAGWGKVKQYSDSAQRTDDLFFEYSRLLTELQPKVFVAENVSGLVKGSAKGYFIEILKALKAAGYNVKACLLDAQWLGVPQKRQRIIFIGVRNDIGLDPVHPKPFPYRYSVREALPWIDTVLNFPGGDYYDKKGERVPLSEGEPMPTIQASQQRVPLVSDLPKRVVAIEGANGFNGHAYAPADEPAATIQANRTLNVIESETDISKFSIGEEWSKLRPGETSDKYLNLSRASADGACPTVTAMGGISSIAGVTHPFEKRKFSIAELKRICAFPDDFELTGTYTQQWERLGRSVPPVMMSHIAKTIEREILCKIKNKI